MLLSGAHASVPAQIQPTRPHPNTPYPNTHVIAK